MSFTSIRRSWYSRSISFCLIVTFVMTMIIAPRAQASIMGLPQPGAMVDLSPSYVPLMITGLSLHPENPLLMDFIVSTGNSGLNTDQVKKGSDRLIKYFLACLTIPENNQWVNLSPYEKQRIIPTDLGETVLGQDMMAQDYLLKQLTASLIYPEKNLGKNFWDNVYTKASQMYGTTQIPVNTFNKVWILPDTAKVFEHGNTVYVVKSHLKVMLDEDYLALKKHADTGVGANTVSMNNLGSRIVRQIILPAIEKEVNTGRNFAQLRQIYNSMILAVWFKKNLRQALLNQVYTDKSKVNGVNVDDPAIKEKIYRQYLQAYKKGVFNYIKEEMDQNSQQMIPRKYFSGGLEAVKQVDQASLSEAQAAFSGKPLENQDFKVSGLTQGANGNLSYKNAEVTIGSSPEDIDEESGIQPISDNAMATPIQIARGVAYWIGKTAATSITRPFRASRQEDVSDITKLSLSEKQRLEKIAINSLLQGQGVIGMLQAGASSRMNVKDAPPEVRSMAHENIQSKAGVPIGIIDGQTVTYLDAFGINVSRILQQINSEAINSGEGNNKLNENDILLFSNDDYRPEQEGIITAHHNYGLPQQIRFINQPLEPIYWATPADVEALKAKSKFKTEADFQTALAKAKDVQARLEAGEQSAIIVQNQRDPLGHGEFLHQLIVSGELLHMFDTGKKWFFIKNVDNYAAKLDRVWLQILGKFLDQGIDFQPEVSPRAPAQAGGSLIVMEDTGSQQLAEDPTLKATLGADGKPKVSPTDSFWFNDAVAMGRPEYVASLYQKQGQTLEEFLAEYRQAVESKDSEALEAIAERGRAKFPKLIDPKLAKNEPGATIKIETNMWQSTGVAPIEMKIESVGVRGARNFNINEYPSMNQQEQQTELANLRFLATKQWTIDPKSRTEAKTKLETLLGREVTDAEVDLTLESYEGNKRIADDLLRYILKADLVTPGILTATGNVDSDSAMTTRIAKVKVRALSIFTRVSPKDRSVPIKQGTAGWRAFVHLGGDQQNGEGPFNQANIGRAVAALATQFNSWVKQGTYLRVREDGKLHALVAFDGRANGKEFALHAASVAYAYGMEVDISSDYVSTPEAIGRSLRSLGNKAYDVVIVVTASHNDYRYNGLKIGMNGTIMPDNLSSQVDALANDPNFRVSYYHADNDVQFNKVDLKAFASQNYQKAFPGLIASVLSYLGATRKKLIVDFMHGSDGRYADDYRQMGADVRKTEPMRDNIFPKKMFLENGNEVPYRPQPIREMLDQELTDFETNSDIPEGSVYSALDGDGDRFAAWVKQNGVAREISPNEVMLLTLWHLKQENRLPSELKYVVVTAPTSYMVRKYAESIGLKVIEEPVGFKFLGPHLNGQDSHQAVLAWEESGHGGFRMVSPTGEETTFLDDANAQSLYFLDIVSSLPQGQDVLSVLDDLRKQINYKLNFDRIAVNGTDESKDKIRIPLKEGTAASVRGIAAEISRSLGEATPSDENISMTSTADKEVSLADFLLHRGANLKLNEGLKLKFDDDSWVMVRMSGTEPLIRIYGELKSENPRNELNKLAKDIFNDRAMTSFPDEELDTLGNDRAVTANIQPWERGGIDLNSRTLNMESVGQKVNITFDPAMIEQFKRGDFTGVRIQILDVAPVNLGPLLGLNE